VIHSGRSDCQQRERGGAVAAVRPEGVVDQLVKIGGKGGFSSKSRWRWLRLRVRDRPRIWEYSQMAGPKCFAGSLHEKGSGPIGGRVERWRGGLGAAYPLPALSSAGASLAVPCPVSTARSSNRTCRFPASGSRTRWGHASRTRGVVAPSSRWHATSPVASQP
jgi:hypothetical protein